MQCEGNFIAPAKRSLCFSKSLLERSNMKRQSKLTPREEPVLGEQLAQQQGAKEFASVEEMLRHDALHTPVPPTIAFRLQESIGALPRRQQTWWRRLFGS